MTVAAVVNSVVVTPNPADIAIAFARQQIGKPYQWGATGPNSFDCSGLVQQAYKAAGIDLPRTTYTMVGMGKAVAKSDLGIGDLLFPDPGHVQLYSGNGNVIEAPYTGAKVREVNMWGFWQARRVAGIPGTGTAADPTLTKSIPGYPDLGDIAKDPVAAFKQIITTLSDITKVIEFFGDPKNWIRMAEFGAGVGLLLVGLAMYHEVDIAGIADKVSVSNVSTLTEGTA